MNTTQMALRHWGETSLPPDGAKLLVPSALGRALVLATTAKSRRPLVAVFPDKASARAALEHTAFFLGRESEGRLHYLPAPEFDFYRGLLPNPETLFERNVALYHALNDAEGRIFFTTVGALLQRAFPVEEFVAATRAVHPNDELDRDAFVRSLQEAGYTRQPSVLDPGTFAVRGGVVDVFCPLYPEPFRIELFGDLVDEIRFFDPQSQRSSDKETEVVVVPVGATLLPRLDRLPAVKELIKERLDHMGVPKPRRDELMEKAGGSSAAPELSLLSPYLCGGSASLNEYFPKNTLFFWDGKAQTLEAVRERELPKLLKHHSLFEEDKHPIASREELFLGVDDFTALFERPGRYFFEEFSANETDTQLSLTCERISLAHEREAAKQRQGGEPPLEGFVRKFRDWLDKGTRIFVVSHTRMHAERTQMLFAPYGLRFEVGPEGTPALDAVLAPPANVVPPIALWQGYLGESCHFPDLGVLLLSEEELFGLKKRTAKNAAWKATSDATKLLATFRDLKEGDFVVHKDHGVGKYLGLRSMEFSGLSGDYVLLEYRDGDKLYVPVYRLNVLQKYVGGEGAQPAVDKLGGDRWLKATAKARRAVAELAAEFLEMQARRKLIPAFTCSPTGDEYRQFEMSFPYDETPDQMRAIEQVQEDLGKTYPMDRLLCGDVGYGKTEVAMRAAHRLTADGKQVAVLVPTTVLAYQHFENFKTRFRDTAVRIEMVSRLRTAAETKKILDDVQKGKVDILIGTHRLLSPDLQFKDLGIVIVDEEHRFGVVQKERLKKMSATVHVLAMTATPIPRTLNMAMSGIKDVSILATPPPDRLSVRTFVTRSAPEIVAEAITNELARDGQVFFVHNRIESLFDTVKDLQKLLPKVRFEVAHGQMDGEELEKKMLAFYRGEAQVLVCTAIIESGIDIPRANTILIDQAHYFGLAQLYQLRGRVGRSEKRAYCYLLVPSETGLSEDARQRLQVIQRYTDLGSGFSVASHDLDIRGAGDLLGKEQSGHLTAVGIDMYFELLEEAMMELRGRPKESEIEPEISMKISAFFPADYLPDVAERVGIYRRLSSVRSEEEISRIEEEIRDRFGPPPDEVTNLLGLMTLKMHLKRLHVVRMSCGPKRTSLQFAPTTPAQPEKLIALLHKSKGRFTLTPDQKLVFPVEKSDWQSQLDGVLAISRELGVATS